jgi:hypothetical protein
MTTIINNPPGNGDNGNSSSAFVAVIIIILLLAGGFLFYRYVWHRAAPASTTNINVTIPTAPSSAPVGTSNQ